MDILLFAFANDRHQPLPTLTEEYLAINQILAPRVLRQHFLAWAISHATLDDVAYYLTLFRDRIKFFQFSGHAGRDFLLLENGHNRTEGIIHLLGQCPHLEVVVLNGCSTRSQVDALHQAGIPLVIATSAPVNDHKATRFSKRLLQALETGQSVETAFELACGEVLAQQSINIYRDLGSLRQGKDEAAVWCMLAHPDQPQSRQWCLPSKASQVSTSDLEPNELLLDTLFETFARTHVEVRQLWETNKNLEEDRESIISALLKALPAPISEQIRKLVMPSMPGAAAGFDKPGPMRLEQMAQTYQITMDFMVFTMLAQIWEMSYRAHWITKAALQSALLEYLHLQPEERPDYDYFSLIRTLQPAFAGEKDTLFIQEFAELHDKFINNEAIKNACFFLETLRRQVEVAHAMDMHELCERAEKALAELFKELDYLGHYILATIRNIDVQKYRYKQDAQFEHLVMKWHGAIGMYDKEYRRQPQFMDNRSVVLLKWEEKGRANRFLNLSPFILDENTFEQVPDLSLSKLYFFSSKEGETLYYKCINDPEGDIIDLDDPAFYLRKKKRTKFQLAKDQFQAFFDHLLKA